MSRRKYVIIFILALAALLCMVGASTWIITTPSQMTPTWDKGQMPVYVKRVAESNYTEGGIAVKDLGGLIEFCDEDGQPLSQEEQGQITVNSENAVLSNNDDDRNSEGAIEQTGGTVQIGCTYKVSEITITISRDSPLYIAGTYVTNPKDSNEPLKSEMGENKNEYIKQDSSTQYIFTKLLYKYKTVQIGTGNISGEKDGLLATQRQTLSLSFRSTTIDGSSWFTIEEALAKASNDQVIRLVGSTTTTTSSDDAVVTSFTRLSTEFTGYDKENRVKSSVKLFLPYNGNDGVSDELEATHEKVLGNENFNKCELMIPSSMTLVNEGQIILGGETTGVQNSNGIGHTAGLYAQIILGKDSKITSSGEILSYGFIKEEVQNNGSCVDMIKGGKLSMPFWIKEHRGGSNLSSMAGEPEGSPFNRYIFENVTSKLTIANGAFVVGKAYILINTLTQHVRSDVNFIGDTTDYFVHLKDGAHVEWKYSIEPWKISDTLTMAADTVKLDIYGNITINPLFVSVARAAEISTRKAGIPIPWHFYIAFHAAEGQESATVDSLNQDIKILPGGTIRIEEKVTLEIEQLIVHDSTFKNPAAGATAYSNGNSAQPNGVFVVNGTVFADKLGGYVSNEVDGAQLRTTANAAQSSEFTGTDSKWEVTSKLLEGYVLLNGIQQSKQPEVLSANTLYNAKDHVWRAQEDSVVTYHANGGTFSSNGNDQRTQSYFNGWQGTENTLTYATLAEAEVPVRPYYRFRGWAENEKSTADDVVQRDITLIVGHEQHLYAVWEPIEYTFNYIVVDTNGAIDDHGEICTWNIEDVEFDLASFVPDKYKDLQDYHVDGWYLTDAFKNGQSSINKDTIGIFFPDDTKTEITLYARLEESFEASVQYEIGVPDGQDDTSFRNTYANGMGDSTRATIAGGEPFDDLPNINSAKQDEDTSLPYYFVGWKTKDGTDVTASTTAAKAMVENGVIVITATWAKKAHVTISDDLFTEVRHEGYYKPGAPLNVKDKTNEETLHSLDYDVEQNVTYFTGNWTTNVSNKVQSDGSFTVPAGDGAEISIQSERKAKVTLTVTVTATGTNGGAISKGETKKASVKVSFSNYSKTLSQTATGEGGGRLWGKGSTETKEIKAYLAKGQTYTIAIYDGTLASGSVTGEAQEQPINVTVSNA